MRTGCRPISCCEPRSASGPCSGRPIPRGPPAGGAGACRPARRARTRRRGAGGRPSAARRHPSRSPSRSTRTPRSPGPSPPRAGPPPGATAAIPPTTTTLEPLPERAPAPDRGRGAPPMSRAARAQRIGRPGRPALPPQSPEAQALVPALRRPDRAAARSAPRSTPSTRPSSRSSPTTSRPAPSRSRSPRAPTRAASASCSRPRAWSTTRASSRSTRRVTLRRNKLITGNYVLRRNMTNGAAIEALMQGPKVRVVKTFNVGVPEGLSRREAAKVLAGSGIEGNYLKATRSRAAIAPRPQARRCRASRRTLEGFLFPATYELKAGRHGARPRRPPARRVPRQLRLDQPEGRPAPQPQPLRRRHDRLDDRARDAVGEGAAADRLGDLQPAAARRAARHRRHDPLRREQLEPAAQASPSSRRTRRTTRGSTPGCRRRRSATPGSPR